MSTDRHLHGTCAARSPEAGNLCVLPDTAAAHHAGHESALVDNARSSWGTTERERRRWAANSWARPPTPVTPTCPVCGLHDAEMTRLPDHPDIVTVACPNLPRIVGSRYLEGHHEQPEDAQLHRAADRVLDNPALDPHFADALATLLRSAAMIGTWQGEPLDRARSLAAAVCAAPTEPPQ